MTTTTATSTDFSAAESTRTAAQQAFRDHLKYLSAGQIDQWVELFTDDGVLEFPYAPAGFPESVKGKTELHEYMKNFPEHFEVEFTDLRFHETTDPALVIAEFASRGTALATGRPYNQRYISLVETRDGRISRYVDYWNPQVAAESLRGAEVDGVFSSIRDLA
ncbi:nuclear transport factor 2 family protein [Streptomyces pharetrae]|uniref:nuclear transport factor 2 family protein n=1 Tax=Streptomyces pharetrae TaxID=291370 RepID=UPI00345FB64D